MRIQSIKEISIGRLKFLIYGAPGVGKTFLASTIGEPTCVVSAEAGLLSLLKEKNKNLDVIDITTDDKGDVIPKERRIARLVSVYEYLNTEQARIKYKWIYIDSLTEIAESQLEALALVFPERKDILPMYGEYNKKMRSLIKNFRDLPWYNVVFTALEKEEFDQFKVKSIRPEMAGSIAKKCAGYFDEVFHMSVKDNGETTKKQSVTNTPERVLLTCPNDTIVAKDRSGNLSQFERPDLSYIAKKIHGEL